MKIAFAGTPEFARQALQALHAAGHEVVLVMTQPDRPAGRGQRVQPSAVKQFALAHGMALCQPRGLRQDGRFGDEAQAARAALEDAAPDVLVVAAYGLILPAWVLALPRLGALNIHGSLLPRWRGAAPIQRAIEAGDHETGITIMQMDAGLDTGDMLLTRQVAISGDDTAATLHDRLALEGARLIVQALRDLQQGGMRARPQPSEGVTYAHKIDKREAAIDWRAHAELLERRVRAFDPFPGATAEIDGQTMKVWRARVVAGGGVAGQRLDAGSGQLVVACGEGALELLTLQLPGGRRITAHDFLQRQAAQTRT